MRDPMHKLVMIKIVYWCDDGKLDSDGSGEWTCITAKHDYITKQKLAATLQSHLAPIYYSYIEHKITHINSFIMAH